MTVDEMLHDVKAVRRGVRDALLIADMPFSSLSHRRRRMRSAMPCVSSKKAAPKW